MSADEYVTVINGKASGTMGYEDAMARAEHAGTFRGKTVEVHKLRKGKTAQVVAAWKNFERTK